MKIARTRIGSDAFQSDPRADLKSPAKRLIQIPNEREGDEIASEPKGRIPDRPHAEPTSSLIESEPFVDSAPASTASAAEPMTERKVRFGANVPPALKDRADNAAYWVPGMTVSKLVELGLEKEIRRLEKEHNDGQPFADRGQFRFGRPRAGKS